MDVSVRHTPSGRSCMVTVAESDTVLDLKVDALGQMFGDDIHAAREAPGVLARLGGDSEGAELGDAQRIADTQLSGGDEVELAQRWVALHSPAEYNVGSSHVCCIALSPCGALCAIGTFDAHAFVFDTTTAEPVTRFMQGERCITCVTFSKCGMRLAVCSSDNTIYIRDTGTWACTMLEDHTAYVSAAAWAHCGRLVSGSSDRTVRVWDADQGVCTAVLSGHTANVNGVDVSHTSIFSASSDKSIRVWDLATLTHKHTLDGHAGPVRHVTLTTDGRHLVSCSRDKTVKIWCTATRTCIRTLQTQAASDCAAVSQEADVLAASSDDRTQVWCLSSGQHMGTVRETCSYYFNPTVALSPCGRWLFAPGPNKVCVSSLSECQAAYQP